MSDATRATILFVDDSPTMRGMIRAALTQGGYDIAVKNLGSARISHRQLAKAVARRGGQSPPCRLRGERSGFSEGDRLPIRIMSRYTETSAPLGRRSARAACPAE
jgi:nucleoside-diphosphate-sugar epimerase